MLRNKISIEKYPARYFTQVARLSNRNWKSANQTLQIRNKGFIKVKKVGGRYPTDLSTKGITLLRMVEILENWLPPIRDMLEKDEIKGLNT